MKRWFSSWITLIAFAIAAIAAETPVSPESDNPNEVRPTGVPAHRSRAKAKSDSDESPTPRPRRTHRSTKSGASEEEAIPTQTVPGSIPKTGAVSVIVINASNGQVLYEKNADQIRAPASTTKLLTGLIVAESGNLDRPVTVAQVDTLAEPVKLNIKPGDVYQRIDLLRALLVKSPNDVARCLARDNGGSVEAFAEKMNQIALAAGARNCNWVNP